MPVGLYVHVPFCPVICPYCDFYKQRWSVSKEQLFIHHLGIEMEQYFRRYGKLLVDTIYIGGGTPNALTQQGVHQIIASIHDWFDIVSHAEITIELNPGLSDASFLTGLRTMGVNRVSVGVQSFDADVLLFYGRNHDPQDAHIMLDLLQDVGIDNVSIDIIFGHHDHSLNQLKTSLEVICDRSLPHVSLYGLSIEPGTPFHYQSVQVDDHIHYDQYRYLQSYLKKNGYGQYEVSTFCREGMASKHNCKYLTFQPVIGLGAGAHSYFMGHRYENVRDYQRYIYSLDDKLPKDERPLSLTDVDLYLATRLRLIEPIHQQSLKHLFGMDIFEQLLPKLREFSVMNWVTLGEDWFMISDAGCIILDALLPHVSIDA